jgi:hypothetical protein
MLILKRNYISLFACTSYQQEQLGKFYNIICNIMNLRVWSQTGISLSGLGISRNNFSLVIASMVY